MLDYIKKLITPDMVSFWVPSGQNRAMDLIRGNHGQCYGTHPNVPVLPNVINPSVGWVFGGDDWVEVPDDKSLDMTDAITVGLWINLADVVAETEQFVSHMINRDTEAAFEFFSYGALLVIYFNNNDPNVSFNVTCLTSSEWQFVAFTYDKSLASNNIKLFRNAVVRAQKTYSQPLLVSSANLRIGHPTASLDGYGALPFIAKKAWSQQQVNNFYLGTRSFFSPRG